MAYTSCIVITGRCFVDSPYEQLKDQKNGHGNNNDTEACASAETDTTNGTYAG